MPGTWSGNKKTEPHEISNSYDCDPSSEQTAAEGCPPIFCRDLPIFVIHCTRLGAFHFPHVGRERFFGFVSS